MRTAATLFRMSDAKATLEKRKPPIPEAANIMIAKLLAILPAFTQQHKPASRYIPLYEGAFSSPNPSYEQEGALQNNGAKV